MRENLKCPLVVRSMYGVIAQMFVYLSFLERNVLYPAVVVAATSQDAPAIATKYGDAVGALIICVCALKCSYHYFSY